MFPILDLPEIRLVRIKDKELSSTQLYLSPMRLLEKALARVRFTCPRQQKKNFSGFKLFLQESRQPHPSKSHLLSTCEKWKQVSSEDKKWYMERAKLMKLQASSKSKTPAEETTGVYPKRLRVPGMRSAYSFYMAYELKGKNIRDLSKAYTLWGQENEEIKHSYKILEKQDRERKIFEKEALDRFEFVVRLLKTAKSPLVKLRSIYQCYREHLTESLIERGWARPKKIDSFALANYKQLDIPERQQFKDAQKVTNNEILTKLLHAVIEKSCIQFGELLNLSNQESEDSDFQFEENFFAMDLEF